LGSGRRPLEDFESILRTIERMNPEKEEPFFYSSVDYELSALEKENTRFKDIMFCANLASDIDKVARIWIENILHSAAVLAKNEKSGALLRNAVSLPKNADIRVINIVLNNHPLVGLDDDQEDDDEKKKRIERLKMRIEELQKFSKLNKVLIKGYKKDLDDLL